MPQTPEGHLYCRVPTSRIIYVDRSYYVTVRENRYHLHEANQLINGGWIGGEVRTFDSMEELEKVIPHDFIKTMNDATAVSLCRYSSPKRFFELKISQ